MKSWLIRNSDGGALLLKRYTVDPWAQLLTCLVHTPLIDNGSFDSSALTVGTDGMSTTILVGFRA
jgi:hypothetical protein